MDGFVQGVLTGIGAWLLLLGGIAVILILRETLGRLRWRWLRLLVSRKHALVVWFLGCVALAVITNWAATWSFVCVAGAIIGDRIQQQDRA